MQFRDKDRVLVAGTVKAVKEDGVLIEFDGYVAAEVGYTKVAADMVRLDHHHFEVGDRVYEDGGELSGTVVAIDGTMMWMKTERGADHFLRLAEVRHDDELEPLLTGSD